MRTLVALFCIILCSNVAYAYDDTTTHPGLTSEIVTFYNATHSGNPLTDEERGWLIEGSKAEDTAPRWINHFYDPVHKVAWTGEHEGSTSPYAVMLFAKFGLSQKDPLTAVRWANSDVLQSEYARYGGDETWKRATEAFAKGNRKAAFVALGHVLHLAEDMAVPDHTRNDTHAAMAGIESNEASPLEGYATRYDEAGIKKLHIADKLIASKTPETTSASIESHLAELAKYSNEYFFSKDTINSSKYDTPKVIGDSGLYGVGIDEDGSRFLLVGAKMAWGGAGAIPTGTYLLEDKANYYPIYKAYFTRLSRQVVLHGAGIIDLFYKQADDAKVALEFPTRIVQYDKTWGRLPTISLFGEVAKMGIAISGVWNNVTGKWEFLVEKFSSSTPETILVSTTTKSEVVGVSAEEDDSEESEIVFAINDELESPIVEAATSTIIVPMSEEATSTVREAAVEIVTSSVVQAVEQSNGGTTSVRSAPQSVDMWVDTHAEITEIMYNPSGSDDKREWIEIWNSGAVPLAAGEMKFAEGGTNHGITLVSGDGMLQPGAYAVIARDALSFTGEWPAYAGLLFTGAFSLSNDGEILALKGGDHLLHETSYASSSGAYSDGKSLQLTDGIWRAARPTPGGGSRGNEAPAAVVTYMPSDAQAGEVIDFSAASSTDSDGAIVSYVWDFGDGVTTSSTQVASMGLLMTTSSHMYAVAGNYEARLVLTDNEGASSMRAFTLAITPKGARGVRHVVISELQTQGEDAGDEFVELYNPTDTAIDISGWSVQYASGASEVSTTTIAKKNFVAGAILPARGFFLIARDKNVSGLDGYLGARKADMLHRTFSLSGNGGKVFLVAGQEKIGAVDDSAVIDYVDYALSPPSAGKSIERKAWVAEVCASALSMTSGEFFGHGCDSDAIADFEVRDVPSPQNFENFPEPRTAPGTPVGIDGAMGSIAQYNSTSVVMAFAWQPSNDFRGSTSSVVYELYDMSTTTPARILDTTSTTHGVRIQEIGRVYAYALRARDTEGLYSATSTFSVTVPSFFSRLYFSQDTRASSSQQYLIDAYYDRYPFVPSFHGDYAASRMVVFYFNDDPAPQEWMQGQSAGSFESLTHALAVLYKPSSGGSGYGTSKGVEFLDSNSCPGYGSCGNQLAFSELEDMHITLPLASTTSNLSLSPSDYVTAAFYDVNPSGGGITGSLYYTLVAKDVMHYAFGEAPKRAVPQLPSAVSVTHNKANSSIVMNWDNAADSDSLDKHIVYEINFSPLGGIDDARWIPVDTFGCYHYGNVSPCRYARAVGIDDSFLVSVRARDEFGNYSDVQTSEWKQASSTIFISQTEANDWSGNFGYAADGDSSVAASFQSFTPTEDFSFNMVGLKLWHIQGGDSAVLRLSVYPDNGSSKPDFTNPLGQTTLGIFSGTDKEREHAFVFDVPVRVASSTRYWFTLDAPYQSDAGFYNGSAWVNAIQLGDIYTDGDAGRGFGQGKNAQCGTYCRFEGWYHNKGNADWYMRIGYRGS